MTQASSAVPLNLDDPVNAAVLSVSEDQLEGFQVDPFGEIARRSGVNLETVLERIRALLEAGTIRRVRQTLLANNLAEGALVAWQVPNDRLQEAFDYLFREDPFSGHVVIRTTDSVTPGSSYRLWTTLKVPQGYAIEKHCDYLKKQIGAESYLIMQAKALFVLGVGHTRRRGMEPGSRDDEPADIMVPQVADLSDKEWRVLTALKRELAPDEIKADFWKGRADEAGVGLDEFAEVARSFAERKFIGRFSTFLEHVKETASGERVTRYNALFHWAVPAGREVDAGKEVGRHHIITHAYWREGGPEFKNVNIMAVAHGQDKATVLAHKAAIDKHLEKAGIPVAYTNVFWGGRSEIKPSEISPFAYEAWCRERGIDPQSMRE
ncbi:MAG TPA: Lrp/AsnC family transcriptional regulator [Dehalococcoidia bacterium]|nr:Lrp/AsnC family transcriptional regulator [Dehalococcoidia bacterium]